jgi:hypothetical protein
MIATLEQDILKIIEQFKKHVNHSFTATPHDLQKIKDIITNYPSGKETLDRTNNLYTCIDYAGLKRHGVKDFSFSLEDYSEWQNETIEILKKEYASRRKPVCL